MCIHSTPPTLTFYLLVSAVILKIGVISTRMAVFWRFWSLGWPMASRASRTVISIFSVGSESHRWNRPFWKFLSSVMNLIIGDQLKYLVIGHWLCYVGLKWFEMTVCWLYANMFKRNNFFANFADLFLFSGISTDATYLLNLIPQPLKQNIARASMYVCIPLIGFTSLQSNGILDVLTSQPLKLAGK